MHITESDMVTIASAPIFQNNEFNNEYYQILINHTPSTKLSGGLT